MPEFKLEVYPDNYSYRVNIKHNARRFVEIYTKRHPTWKGLGGFFEDLERGRFWGVLHMIDGSYNPLQPDSLEKREKAREWAREHFNRDELEWILEICANTALLVPFKTAWPGTYKGHSILYCELVDKKDSMFYGVVDDSFGKRLNNGRFWEELPDMFESLNHGNAYNVVEDVLIHHSEDLDVNFAPNGFKIFKRNNGETSKFNLDRLSDTAIDNYADFVRRIHMQHEKSRLRREDIAFLVRPYVKASISLISEYPTSEPRFENFGERLQEPSIAEYLSFDFIRNYIAYELGLEVMHGSNPEHVFNVLRIAPNQKELFESVTKKLNSTYDTNKFKMLCKQYGYPF